MHDVEIGNAEKAVRVSTKEYPAGIVFCLFSREVHPCKFKKDH
ncbi:MAG: hypothetical protein OJF50_005575 [Nitrospira sp.]|nr:hypothetical protein [Nitrospira sp.]